MKICAISDTHSYHRKIKIPDADVLVVCGDLSWRGELSIIEDFSAWLKELPIKEKAIIFGNHDLFSKGRPNRKTALQMIEASGAHYLENSSVEIDGIHFYGSPITPFFHDWEWNVQRGPQIAKYWDQIPLTTNVLITHGPPYGILDKTLPEFGGENVGCEDLLARVKELPNLKAHCYGHIHPGYGSIEKDGILFVNASTCTNKYDPINPPIVFEI